jgi:hypothetical protein
MWEDRMLGEIRRDFHGNRSGEEVVDMKNKKKQQQYQQLLTDGQFSVY